MVEEEQLADCLDILSNMQPNANMEKWKWDKDHDKGISVKSMKT